MLKILTLLTALLFLSKSPLHAQSPSPRLTQVMDSCIKKGFNGVVLIADKGKITYKKYTGWANRHYDIPFSPASRFHIFSVTKTFTAALIMQLEEENKVSLDSTISVYYPEYKGAAGKKATIRNLLTYSSGRDLKEMRDLLEVYSNDIWGLDSFITKFCSEKLIDTPGKKFEYSNGDYILLGKIIEKVYGKPYEVVLREKILTPLKMQHSGLLHHDDIIKGMAESYSYRDSLPAQNSAPAWSSGQTQVSAPINASGPAENPIPALHSGHIQVPAGDPLAPHFYTPTNYYIDNLYSAGGMYSTPEDLLLFDQAIFNHTLLKKATVDTMLTSYKDLGEVAFGFWVYPKQFGKLNTLLAERQGGGYGNHSNWIHLIDRDLTFIFLANTDAVDLNTMRFRVISAYLGQ